MKKSSKLGQRRWSGIANNPECVGVGALVGGVQCWLVDVACVSVVISILHLGN